MVMVHVDQAVLADPATDGESRIEDGRAISGETARRLACDASVVEISPGPDGPVAGRRTRVVSATLARALLVRDEGRCRFPGCSCRVVDAHHVEHWARGGATVVSNLISMCRYHHTLVHEGGFGVSGDSAGGFRFTRPNGSIIPDAPPAPPGGAHATVTDEDLRRDRRTLMSTWDGGRVDYGELGWFLS